MAKKPAKSTTLEAIEAALAADGAAFLRAVRKKHSKETIYAFLFELSDVGYYANAAIATEEGLARTAEEYGDSYDDAEQAAAAMRWGSTEDGWYQSSDKDFRQSNQLLEIAEDTELYPEYDGTLEKTALQALKRMIADGVFGTAEELERVTLGICHTGGDNSPADFIRWASAVNSPKVMKRLKAELKKCSG